MMRLVSAIVSSLGSIMSEIPEYLDIDNLAHAPRIAEALGNVMIAWAKAETMLSWAFARVFEIHPNRAFHGFYRIPTFEARIKVIIGMLDQWETTIYDKARIADVIGRISQKSLTRNAWVHGIWCKNMRSDETVIFRFREPEGLGRRITPIRIADIENHLAALRADITELAEAVHYRP